MEEDDSKYRVRLIRSARRYLSGLLHVEHLNIGIALTSSLWRNDLRAITNRNIRARRSRCVRYSVRTRHGTAESMGFVTGRKMRSPD